MSNLRIVTPNDPAKVGDPAKALGHEPIKVWKDTRVGKRLPRTKRNLNRG